MNLTHPTERHPMPVRTMCFLHPVLLVIYTSDNGPWNQPAYTNKKKGHPEGSIFWGDAGPLRAGKGSCDEGGYRVDSFLYSPNALREHMQTLLNTQP